MVPVLKQPRVNTNSRSPTKPSPEAKRRASQDRFLKELEVPTPRQTTTLLEPEPPVKPFNADTSSLDTINK